MAGLARLNLLFREAEPGQKITVQTGRAVEGHGAIPHLGVPGQGDLAHYGHIEWKDKHTGQSSRNRNSAGGYRHDQRLRRPVVLEHAREDLSGVGPVTEDLKSITKPGKFNNLAGHSFAHAHTLFVFVPPCQRGGM